MISGIRNRPRHGAHRPSGFSLIELAVALAALGLVTLLLVQFLATASQQHRAVARRHLLTRADDALLAYAMINSRLPCPDVDHDGDQDCGAGQVGRLPWRTIGLPDANARRIRYGVLRWPSAGNGADLTRNVDRFLPLQVSGTIGMPTAVGNANGLDLCWALRNARQQGPEPAYLHVTRAGSPSSIEANIAYAVALPMRDGDFSGRQAGSAPAFDSPQRPAGPGYHDRVLAVGLGQLWSRMGCGANLAAAGRAHFNAAATAELMRGSMEDYRDQLGVVVAMTDAKIDTGAAGIASAASGVATATASVADTVSESLLTFGGASYRVALGAGATAVAAATTVKASMAHQAAQNAHGRANARHDEAGRLAAQARQVAERIQDNARRADAFGLY